MCAVTFNDFPLNLLMHIIKEDALVTLLKQHNSSTIQKNFF